MSLQLGANFPSRWLSADKEVRQQFLRDLNNVCVLLDTKTDFDEWQSDQMVDPDHFVPTKIAAVAHPQAHQSDFPQKAKLPANTLIELEQRLLKQADAVIERALDPLRAELRVWIQEQIRQEIQAIQSQG